MPAQALIDQYKLQLQKLFPPGIAFNQRDGTSLSDWQEAIAVDYARTHEAVDALLLESFPGDSTITANTGLLTDWETLTGLPDACSYLLTALADRQAAVLTQFAVNEGQSAADFKSIASAFGYALTLSTYTTSRCGVMRCGHTPLHGSPWLFAMLASYESLDSNLDKSLECRLERHAHAHTQINFNAWWAGPTLVLANLHHHFVHGEFVTHEASGITVIDSWSNRSTGDDLIGDTNDSNKPVSQIDEDGWPSALLRLVTSRNFSGLSIKDTADASTLLEHQNFSLWAVIRLDTNNEDKIISGGGFNLESYAGFSGFDLLFDYDGGALEVPLFVGPVFVITAATNGTSMWFQVNGGATQTAAVNGTASGTGALTIGGGYDGSIIELIASDFDGIPGSDVTTDAVTSYLTIKYGV